MPEAVIVDGVRTPVGRRGGALAGWHPTDLLAHTLEKLVDRIGIDAHSLDDVIVGCALTRGEQASNFARYAVLGAGLPETVPASAGQGSRRSTLPRKLFAAGMPTLSSRLASSR